MTPTPANFGGAALIARERERQKSVEGWTAAHDDDHPHGELAVAAECYLMDLRQRRGPSHLKWPWDDEDWKPTDDPIRQLVKAGALIAAEIDRLKRGQRERREADV